MAYSTLLPPALGSVGPLYGAGQRWFYSSVDAAAVVDTANYITNGAVLGMKVGDIVFVTDTVTGIITTHRVVTVTAGAGVNLGDGTIVGAAANTD